MSNATQIERYQRLLNYIDSHVGEQLTVAMIEELSFYSYRNINRIFQALNGETIGYYVKRLRIEKAAEYLKYSEASVADIANSVGFSDAASFSKAFKKATGTSPKGYRNSLTIKREMQSMSDNDNENNRFGAIAYELVKRPDLHGVYSQYRGSYKDIAAMSELWEQHVAYALKNKLLDENTVYIAEILDDNEITSNLNCRYNAVVSVSENSDFKDHGAYRRKVLEGGWYAKFVHQGDHASSEDTYEQIYSHWMKHIGLELDDKSTLEIYLNANDGTKKADRITEIYIPVVYAAA